MRRAALVLVMLAGCATDVTVDDGTDSDVTSEDDLNEQDILLRDPDIARKLRDSRDAEALYAVLAMPSASAA